MTHDERISAYIDNELNGDQEQEFLISLAASEGLRKSFRSELVLKNVLHRDESATNPPRRLRAAVFTTLGLGAASAVGASKASAAQPAAAVSRGLVKSLFATKVSTAVTLALLTSSALVGYGVRTVTAPVSTPTEVHTIGAPAMTPPGAPAATDNGVAAQPSVTSVAPERDPVVASAPVSKTVPALHSASNHSSAASHRSETVNAPSEPVNGVAGGNTMRLNPPIIDQSIKK